ncbi:MAG: hypothetical protein EAZ15_08800 [Sphingobacteriales bacterium]|nr:MAG: hypothetical protein EAZ15_08800 [Sphingobacteriales bacterium]
MLSFLNSGFNNNRQSKNIAKTLNPNKTAVKGLVLNALGLYSKKAYSKPTSKQGISHQAEKLLKFMKARVGISMVSTIFI